MQATSATGTTMTWLWRVIPPPVKVCIGIILVVGVAALVYIVVVRVKRLSRAYKFEQRIGKREIGREAVESFVDWLVERSRQASALSKRAYEAKRKEEGLALGSAAASYLTMARWLMPKRTVTVVPGCDEMINVMDEALKERVGTGVPHLEVIYHKDNEVK
jgi:hypothetical protein